MFSHFFFQFQPILFRSQKRCTMCALEVRSGLKNPARPDPGPQALKPDPARARPINLICRPEPEANPKFQDYVHEMSAKPCAKRALALRLLFSSSYIAITLQRRLLCFIQIIYLQQVFLSLVSTHRFSIHFYKHIFI